MTKYAVIVSSLKKQRSSQIRALVQVVLKICLHLLAQEFKHKNHKRDKAQTQNAKVELVPLPCKKAH